MDYAPYDHNKNYRSRLKGMTTAQKWIDEYSKGYNTNNVYQNAGYMDYMYDNDDNRVTVPFATEIPATENK